MMKSQYAFKGLMGILFIAFFCSTQYLVSADAKKANEKQSKEIHWITPKGNKLIYNCSDKVWFKHNCEQSYLSKLRIDKDGFYSGYFKENSTHFKENGQPYWKKGDYTSCFPYDWDEIKIIGLAGKAYDNAKDTKKNLIKSKVKGIPYPIVLVFDSEHKLKTTYPAIPKEDQSLNAGKKKKKKTEVSESICVIS